MNIYFVLMALITGLYLALKKERKLFFVLSGILICLVIGLRDISVGVDTKNYVNLYLYSTEDYIKSFGINSFSLKELFVNDYLYYVYCHILIFFGCSERMFLIISAIIMVTLILRFLYRYSENDYLCILSFLTIGLFTFLFSGIRQGIAISLFTFSYKYIIEEKPLKFTLFTIVAMGFHISAIAAIPAYFFVKLLKKTKDEYSLIICVMTGFLASAIFFSILNMFSLGIRFSGYLSPDAVKTNPLVVILYVSIAVICIILRRSKTTDFNDCEINKVLLIMFEIGVGIVIISLKNTIISRFAYFYLLALPIILANSIKKVKNAKNRIIYSMSCVAIEFLYFMVTVPGSVLNVASYKFFWQ